MFVKDYEAADVFLEACGRYMIKKEAVSQLLLYPVYQNIVKVELGKELYGAVMEEQEPLLLFCNIPGYNLVVLVLETDKADEACTELANYLWKRSVAITGIFAKHELCQSFSSQYKKYQDCTFFQKQDTQLMEIRLVNDIKPVEGFHRLAVQSETKLITDWLLSFLMEALTSELDYEAVLIKAEKLIEEGRVYLYEDEKQIPVSMAVVCDKLLQGIMITYIYTPEEHRGNGYAAANLYYLCKVLLQQDCEFCTLLADKKNPLSIRAYEKVGFLALEEISEYSIVLA